MAELTPEILAFLSEGTRTGKLGYVAADGRPLVAPIWFVVEGSDNLPELLFTTGRDTAKGRAIARDPRIVICVDLEEPPYGFAQIQGDAVVSEDHDDLVRSATTLARRYVGAEQAEEFGRRNAVPGELVVRLQPTRIVAQLDMMS